jgi:hypothetical protein
MSSYQVIDTVSKRLRRLITDAYADDATLKAIVQDEEAISLRNPTETKHDTSKPVSLWLYQITENEFAKNQPRQRVSGNGGGNDLMREPPLTLNLHYLLTPISPNGEKDYLLLGMAMRALYDSASLVLRDAATDTTEDLRIILSRHTLEELTRVWDALKEPYRLSVCYQVDVVHIDSARLPRLAPVRERDAVYARPEPASV